MWEIPVRKNHVQVYRCFSYCSTKAKVVPDLAVVEQKATRILRLSNGMPPLQLNLDPARAAAPAQPGPLPSG